MCVSLIGIKSNTNFIKSMEAVSYESQLKPDIGEDGYYTFVTDDNFKVMQLTDVHIGAGFLSIKKDSMALNAVASMIQEEKPDLVVVSGDIAYPIPFQAGTFNNKNSARLLQLLWSSLVFTGHRHSVTTIRNPIPITQEKISVNFTQAANSAIAFYRQVPRMLTVSATT